MSAKPKKNAAKPAETKKAPAPEATVPGGLWLGFLVTCHYNAAHYALDIIIAVFAPDGAITRHLRRNDAQSHHQ